MNTIAPQYIEALKQGVTLSFNNKMEHVSATIERKTDKHGGYKETYYLWFNGVIIESSVRIDRIERELNRLMLTHELNDRNEEYLCKCNNCETVLIDTNPQTGAIKYPADLDTPELILIKDEDGFLKGCPNCKTDECLKDL